MGVLAVKNKGSALILTILSIAVIMILCTAIVTAAYSEYVFTSYKEQSDKNILVTDSGIEKGLSRLRIAIKENPDIFITPSLLKGNDIPSFSFKEGFSTCTVSFSDKTLTDDSGNNVDTVKITSQSVNLRGNHKTLSVYINKNDLSNDYYEMLFNNSITVLDNNLGSTNYSSALIGNPNDDMAYNGNMYLQGSQIKVNPKIIRDIDDADNPYDSNIVVTVNSRNTNLNADIIADNSVTKKTSSQVFNILDILPTTDSNRGDLKPFYVNDTNTIGYNSVDLYYNNEPNSSRKAMIKNIMDNYNIEACRQVDNNGVVTLVTIKATKKNSTTTSFNWGAFVSDVKDYIMRTMVQVTLSDGSKSYYKGKMPSNNDYDSSFTPPKDKYGHTLKVIGSGFEDLYKGMYKLYIVEGDVVLYTPSDTGSFINHIIYCTGTLTFKPGYSCENNDDRSYVKFINSSVMSKNAVIKDIRSYNSQSERAYYCALSWDGIKQLDDKSNPQYSPFSFYNRGLINRFLIKHLKGYENAIKFKIYKAEEN